MDLFRWHVGECRGSADRTQAGFLPAREWLRVELPSAEQKKGMAFAIPWCNCAELAT